MVEYLSKVTLKIPLDRSIKNSIDKFIKQVQY